MNALVLLIFQLHQAANSKSGHSPQWSWVPELSSVSVSPDSSVSVDYVIRIHGSKAGLFCTMDLSSVKNLKQDRACIGCTAYSMDSIRISLLDSAGNVYSENTSPFGVIQESRKGETLVIFRNVNFLKVKHGYSRIRFSYIHNSYTPIFNSFSVEPRVDYSKTMQPFDLPVRFFTDDSI